MQDGGNISKDMSEPKVESSGSHSSNDLRTIIDTEEITRYININSDLVDDPDYHLRDYVIKLVMPIFKWANGIVLAMVLVCLVVDIAMMVYKENYVRIVDESVIISLVGSTTIQLGILVVTIGGYLFPKKISDIKYKGPRQSIEDKSRRINQH